MSIPRKDKKIELSWRLENSNRYQIERLLHISNTIIVIALFTKSLETMTLMYSSKSNNNDSRDKTTTSRVQYSRNDSSDDDNIYTDRYKQGKRQSDVAPRGDEREEQMHAEKRIRDLEDDVKELEAVNKRLKEKLKNYKKKVRRSSKGDIRDSNGWTGNEAILTDKVTGFSRDYMFPRYKFLEVGWQDYDPTNKKRLSYFVRRKMADTYRSMRIPTIGREFEDQWERVYVPVIGLKYQNMRCKLGNDVQAQYFGELHD